MGAITRRIANNLTLGSGRVLLNTTTITSDTATLNFDNTLITATYGIYEVFIEYMSSANGTATDGHFQLSPDNGSNFSTSIDQMSHRERQDDNSSGGNVFDIASKDDQAVRIFSGTEDNLPNIGVGLITVFSPMKSDSHTLVTHTTCNDVPGSADNIRNHFGVGRDDNAQAINYFRLKFAAGDIQKAQVKLYGVL